MRTSALAEYREVVRLDPDGEIGQDATQAAQWLESEINELKTKIRGAIP